MRYGLDVWISKFFTLNHIWEILGLGWFKYCLSTAFTVPMADIANQSQHSFRLSPIPPNLAWGSARTPHFTFCQSTASAARELVIQRLGLVRSLCESEEQRLLEQVHGEEERAHQSILTQRVHWAEALQKLDTIRTSLVDMLTHLDDLQLIVSQARVKTQPVGQTPPRSENIENVYW